jgi:uncharacterized protein (DUF1810 family)
MSNPTDPHLLNRFVQAQKDDYDQALAEVRRGEKRTHWMWYIYPQLAGLGYSSTARFYAIQNLEEARAYLNHPLLGPRLLECAAAALAVPGKTAHDIFGSPDDMKLKSCATLFGLVSPPASVFQQLLDKYFMAERDSRTLDLLGIASEG